eukprot:COSAG04_NODE_1835_length_5442_cov_19.996631_4_plen_210_part_00
MAFRTVLQQRVRVCPSGRTDAGVSARGQVCQFDALYPHPPDTLGASSRYAQSLRVTANPSRLAVVTSAPAERGAAAGRPRPRADNRRPGLRRDVDKMEAVCVHRARRGGQRQRRVRCCPAQVFVHTLSSVALAWLSAVQLCRLLSAALSAAPCGVADSDRVLASQAAGLLPPDPTEPPGRRHHRRRWYAPSQRAVSKRLRNSCWCFVWW